MNAPLKFILYCLLNSGSNRISAMCFVFFVFYYREDGCPNGFVPRWTTTAS